MNDNGSANPSRSTGLLTAGLVIAGLIAAAAFLSLRDSGRLSEEAVAVLEASERAGINTVVTPGEPAGERQGVPDAAASGTDPATADETVAPAETAETVTATVPTIDEVRVDTGGTMVIAGRAEPGADVDVLVDGEVVTSAQADASGAFAAVGSVSADESARSLTLRSGTGDSAVASADEIILTPIAPRSTAPADTQAQQPEAETTPAQPDIAIASTGASDDAGAFAEPAARSDASADATPEEAQETAASAAPAPDATQSGAEVAQSADVGGLADAPRASDDVSDAPRGTDVAVLRSDEQGVSRVQTAPVSRVMLDTISYSDDGAVQLGGRAGADAVEVRAYLDNRAVARMSVDPDGLWRGVIIDVAAGVYRLRVDALGQDGAVTSRLETPFKREAPAVLAAATQAATGSIQAITVQAGDTLWAIARDRYGEGLLYVQVFEANRGEIRDPDLIYPGQVFDLPAD